MLRRLTLVLVAASAGCVALGTMIGPGGTTGMGPGRALILGTVEGATEFLPISSTGHLVLVDHLLSEDGAGDAEADAFLVIVQIGAIAAVLGLYRHRIGTVVRGIRHRGHGRTIGGALTIAALPALAFGALAGPAIKDRLLEPAPVTAALVAGGLAILGVGSWYRRRETGGGGALEDITSKTALLIGAAQVLALWPGVSRSLVTILGGVAAGLTVPAAVEFSFLLGAIVLTAASCYELVIGDAAATEPLPLAVGLVAAFVTATVAIRWMVAAVAQRDLRVFGWYRLGVGGLASLLMAAGVLHA